MFDLLIRPGFGEAPPQVGERFYCEDWRCPARDQCERHYGRSYAYVAMTAWWDGGDKTPFHTPERVPFAAACEHYKLDKPREWLRGDCEPQDGSWCCIGCDRPECARRSNVVPFPARGGVA